MAVTFQEAGEIVRKAMGSQIEEPYVADWGHENHEYWMPEVADKRWLVDHDPEFEPPIDDRVLLVRKSDGEVVIMSFVANLEFMFSFTPVGKIPDFFNE